MNTLSQIWSRWKAFSLKVAAFQARLILTLFYLIFLTPVGILHTFVKDTLNLRGRRIEGWRDHEKHLGIIEGLRQQY